jgi:hypothetical protein
MVAFLCPLFLREAACYANVDDGLYPLPSSALLTHAFVSFLVPDRKVKIRVFMITNHRFPLFSRGYLAYLFLPSASEFSYRERKCHLPEPARTDV